MVNIQEESFSSKIIDDITESAALVMAVWLHNKGHASSLTKTSFRNFDWATYIAEHDQHRLTRLVPHQSSREHYAHLRGLDQVMSRFPVRS